MVARGLHLAAGVASFWAGIVPQNRDDSCPDAVDPGFAEPTLGRADMSDPEEQIVDTGPVQA
jgi:hypothetical protein